MIGTRMCLISGSSHKEFAEDISYNLNIPLTNITLLTFGNDNQFVKLLQNVRGADVFLIQTSCPPVDKNLMETLLIADALKYSSAARITAVIPYMPYVRSDKKDTPRISIAARLVADLYETAGVNRFLTMDLHAEQIQGFFRIPVDQLKVAKIFCNHFRYNFDMNNSVIVAADVGESKHVGYYTNNLKLPLAIIDKRRIGETDTVVPHTIIGDVKGKDCIIIDDEVASGSTLCTASEFLIANGAKSVTAAITHGVLSGNSIENINKSSLTELIITDTIPVKDKIKKSNKIKVISVVDLFSRAIERIYHGMSLNNLF